MNIMGYDQWVTITLKNLSQNTLVIKNVQLFSGKFHKDDDKDTEVPIEIIQNRKIPPTESYKINSCGRELALKGTEGQFDIYVDDHKVRHFYWDCPFWSNPNTWKISEENVEWIVTSSGAGPGPGALGNISVKLSRKEDRSRCELGT